MEVWYIDFWSLSWVKIHIIDISDVLNALRSLVPRGIIQEKKFYQNSFLKSCKCCWEREREGEGYENSYKKNSKGTTRFCQKKVKK